MKVVAIIPMKLNNERLANKNTKEFSNGRPLCSYIFDTISKVNNIDEVYVYCSDENIKKYMPDNIKFLKRSKDLDKSTSTMNEILKSFASEVHADIYVLTHTTSPFLKSNSFEVCIEKIKKEGYDSAFTVKKVQDFLWKDGKPINYDLNNIPRTQDLPIIYSETCGFFIFKKNLIEKENRRIGKNPYLYEVDNIQAIDINEPFDFEIANYFASKFMRENNLCEK